MEHKLLFSTVIGSHIWKMNRPLSDTDVFECYVAPTTDFLLGRFHVGGKWKFHKDGLNRDTVTYEIGDVINGLRENNLNHIIGVISPVVQDSSAPFIELRKIVTKSMSKRAYRSLNGMGFENYKKYIASGKDISPKRVKGVIRVLEWGIELFKTSKLPVFKPAVLSDPFVIPELLEQLKEVKDNTLLPEIPSTLEQLDKWLIELRLSELSYPDRGYT